MLRQIERLLWPLYCAGCGAYDVKLCPSCIEDLRAQIGGRPKSEPSVQADPMSSAQESKPTENQQACARRYFEDVSLPVYVGGTYEGVLRSVILKWKDHGRLDLGVYIRGISIALTRAYLREQLQARRVRFIVVPAPSSPQAVKARGRLQTEEIARAVAKELRAHGHRAKVCHLLRQRNIKKQVNFDAAARASNKKDAIRIRSIASWCTSRYVARACRGRSTEEHSAYVARGGQSKFQGNLHKSERGYDTSIANAPSISSVPKEPPKNARAKVILVDDISTTGTTLAVCQSTLAEARWHLDCALTIASPKTSTTAPPPVGASVEASTQPQWGPKGS
jgi:predicted amidophosphoribosyltransferase